MENHTKAEKAKIVSQVDQIRRDQKLSIKKACKEVGISAPSYYKWKRESLCQEGIKNEFNVEKEAIPKGVVASKINDSDQKKILEIKASFHYMGVKQLRQHLIRNHKLKYSERQIRQLLESNKVPKIKSSFAPQPVRRFERDLPNEMWQTDLMNFHIGSESCYLVSFLDDHSRFIVSYSISDHSGSQEERIALGMRYSRLCKLLTSQGVDVVIAVIGLFKELHDWNRENISNYVEVFIDTPLNELKKRDPKELYKNYDLGRTKNIAGIDLKVDFPLHPDIHLKWSDNKTVDVMFNELIEKL